MVESEFESALREAAAGSDQARRRVYELLAQASLHVETAGPPDILRGGLTLATRTRAGSIEMAVFTSLERALAWNPRADIYRAHAPASWIFSEAQRLGCTAVWINPPECEIRRADFPALAQRLVPGLSPVIAPSLPAARAAPAPAPAPVSEPSKPVPAPAPPAAPRNGAPKMSAPRGLIPGEARTYLAIVLKSVKEISAAYFFDLTMPGEPRMLCLGLRIDLPPAERDEFLEGIEQLADIPGLLNGVAACPLNDEMLATARKVGVPIL